MNQNRRQAAAVGTTQNSHLPRYMYGIHFPGSHPEIDPEGYLLVRKIASGAFGTAYLVLGCADGKLYVRKMDKDARERDERLRFQAAEVSNFINHQNIPRLISFQEYEHWTVYEDGERQQGVKTHSTWEFCNGGTMERFTSTVIDINQQTLNMLGYRSVTPDIPELFIWSVFEDFLGALITAHENGIAHNDIHEGNIFLHWVSRGDLVPKAYLGDWGNSIEYPWRNHPDGRLSRPFHIVDFSQLPNNQPAGSGTSQSNASHTINGQRYKNQDVIDWYHRTRRDYSRIWNSLWRLLCLSRTATITQPRLIVAAAAAGQPVNGYSVGLVAAIGTMNDILGQDMDLMQPWDMLYRIRRLLVTTQRGRMDATAAYANSPSINLNILHVLRPDNSDDTKPAIWPNHESVTNEVRNRGVAVVRSPRGTRPPWTAHLDVGTFEIKRITMFRPNSRWGVFRDEDHTDSDGSSGSDDSNGPPPPLDGGVSSNIAPRPVNTQPPDDSDGLHDWDAPHEIDPDYKPSQRNYNTAYGFSPLPVEIEPELLHLLNWETKRDLPRLNREALRETLLMTDLQLKERALSRGRRNSF